MVAVRSVPFGSVEGIRTREKGSQLWILVVLTVIAIPFEELYSVFGFSIAKLTIIPLFIGVLLLQSRRLLSVLWHRVFLCGIAFVVWGALVENFHPNSNWDLLVRVLQMFILAALVASVTSNPVVFRRVLLALAFVCSILALYLIYNFYALVNTEVTGWRDAGNIRDSAFEESLVMSSGLNIVGYTVGMGAVVALAKFLTASRNKPRILWGGIYVLCAVGSFVPLSRGSFVALLFGSILVLWRSFGRAKRPGVMIFLIGIVILVFSLMPQALIERTPLRTKEEVASGKVDGRARILTASIESIPEYWAIGIGTGNYWSGWARQNGFGKRLTYSVPGPHNGFLAAWIYFGLPGLVLLCLVWLFAARACPKRDATLESVVPFGLLGLGFMWLLFTHSLYLKSFGLILGLLLGASIHRVALERAKRRRMPRPRIGDRLPIRAISDSGYRREGAQREAGSSG